MKKKGNFRKVVSGLLAGMTMLSTVLSPMTAYAAEIQPEEKPPLYEEVKDLLDEDEVVTAKDYEIETGSVFDVKSDYTGLEIKDDNKVKVTFEEAKNDKDEDFTTNHADTYKAVYYVEPVNQEHPKYQISRKLIVREKETETQTETAGSEAVTESETAGSEQQTEEAEDSEADSEITDIDADEFDDLVEQAQNQDTYDEESGLELHDVLEQAGDEGVDLDSMEEGEIATFEAVSAYSARTTQQVTIEKGPLYRYADYNLGTYLTEPYYISYGSVRATAYCVQPAKPGPGSGNYTITKIGDNQALAKVCYYGTDAAGSESFFANKHTDFSEGKRFIIIHMAASYANGSSDAFYGTNATGEALAKELYNYCVNKPEIPDVAMSFSKPNVKAYVDGNVQRTENIKFNASSQQKITMDLPKGVKLHNVSTGNVSAAGASVTIGGGTTFYLSAPLTQTKDVSATFSAKMKGSITKDYSAYKLTTNASVQDLAFVFGEGVADEKYVSLKVSWIEQATIEIVKKDDTDDVNLAGAVFGVYSDEACTKLITQMPATDKNGKSSVTIIKTQDTVYLKEITAPQGYVVNATATNVKLVASKTSSVTVENKEQLAELTIYKEGQVLSGADVSENGTVFQYENRRQKNAVYNVYAGADIVTAYGTKVYPPAPRPLQKDGDLWVFCKPAGLPTHPGTGHEDSLSSRLAARAGDAPFKPTPVHRLDKDTSGILLVAASFSVLRELTTALRERQMKKEYLAWVEGRWPHTGVRLFRHWLRKEADNGREQMHVRQTGAPGNGETEALLLVRPVRVEDRRSLLLVRLLTGRTHQIRAQLSSLGHPIEGDVKYGARGRAAGTPMYLHAMRVILPDGRRFACLPDWPADRLPQAVPDEIDEAAARQGN